MIAQEISQNIRGKIIDQVSLTTLPGANIIIHTTDPKMGISSGLDGDFKFSNVPVGRHDIEVSYLGYESRFLNGINLSAGKELVLEIGLVESLEMLEEVTIIASEQIDKRKALNEFASVSARTFSVEETSRYAAAAYDPARMALNYAGVSVGATDDLSNQIVVRGNSPAGVLWRLEGIEIPSPNHFGELGNSGGGISMLSSSTLSNSDFYTGAFPAEFGNANAAVFDLNLRTGNNQQREYAFMAGVMGIEAAAEGPFKKGGKASYLLNYRYATLGILQKIGLSPTGDVLPSYSDLSFKLNFPSQKFGNFAVFGLGGSNLATGDIVPDTSEWESEDDNEGFSQYTAMQTVGISHKILLDDKSYLRTVVLGARQNYDVEAYYLDTLNNYQRIDAFKDLSKQHTIRSSMTYSRKINAKNNFRAGMVYGVEDFSFSSIERIDSLNSLFTFYDNKATGGLFQSFFQLNHRVNERFSFNSGLHYSQLIFNTKNSIEPRASAQYQMTPKSSLTFSTGLHSKMEHMGFYFFEGLSYGGNPVDNKDQLGLRKSWHNVLAYDVFINPKMRIKTELYYQYLYNIAEASDESSTFSMLNAGTIWDYIGLENAQETGKGYNVGIDLTFEKFLSNGNYYMLTGSLYDSKFVAPNGTKYNTIYNGNFTLNTVAGKEWQLRGTKDRTLGVNGRFVVAGGRRYTPLDLERSLLEGEAKKDPDQLYAEKAMPYGRLDLGINLTTNREKTTHSIRLDVQNATNRQNVFGFDYNDETLDKEIISQTGLFPFINYRIEF